MTSIIEEESYYTEDNSASESESGETSSSFEDIKEVDEEE